MGKEFGDLLRRLRADKKMTQEELATQLGVTFQAVQKWESGVGNPRAYRFPKIAAALGVPRNALFPEEIAPSRRLPISVVIRARSLSPSADLPERRTDLIEVPILEDPIGAGSGRNIRDEAVEGWAWIPADHLRGRRAHRLCAVRVRGHSMEPFISEGAIVVVDHDDREKIDPNAIYAVKVDEEQSAIKHVALSGKALTLISANPDLKHFPPIRVDLRRHPDAVIGRVVWVGQTA